MDFLFAVSTSVFSWSILGCGSSSAAFLLLRPEKGVLWPIQCWTYPVWVAVVALVVAGLVDICSECRTGRTTWRHLSSPTFYVNRCKEIWEFYWTQALQFVFTAILTLFMLQILRWKWCQEQKNMRIWRWQSVWNVWWNSISSLGIWNYSLWHNTPCKYVDLMGIVYRTSMQ